MNATLHVEKDGRGSAWDVARRWQQYRAEVRGNLLRIVAIAGFFLIHRLHHLSAEQAAGFWSMLQLGDGAVLSPELNLAITGIVLAWTMWGVCVLSLLQVHIFPRWLPLASLMVDTGLLTSLLVLTSGARSPLLAGYFLIVILAGQRLDLRWVRLATVACLIGYLVVLGCTRWPQGILLEHPLPTVPRFQQMMTMLALAVAGILVGQQVRLTRSLVDDFDRLEEIGFPNHGGERNFG